MRVILKAARIDTELPQISQQLILNKIHNKIRENDFKIQQVNRKLYQGGSQQNTMACCFVLQNLPLKSILPNPNLTSHIADKAFSVLISSSFCFK